jgi:hypothetical protein
VEVAVRAKVIADAVLPANAASDNMQAVVSLVLRGTAMDVPATLPPQPWELAVSDKAWQAPVQRLKMMPWIRVMV